MLGVRFPPGLHIRTDFWHKEYVVGFFEANSLISNRKATRKKVIPLGYNKLEQKEAFFSGWYVQYPRWGEQYGEGLAVAENTSIVKVLKSRSIVMKSKFNSFMANIDTNKNLIILAQYSAIFEFRYEKNFTPHYQTDKKIKSTGFAGYWRTQNKNIPIFEFSSHSKNKSGKDIFVINIKR